jgi:hypothetical protein
VIGAPMRLPNNDDADTNLLPDSGWKFFANSQEYDAPGTGESPNPFVDQDEGPGLSLGDGISAFEEFRGFVVDGEHRRTNPFVKDVFIDSVFPQVNIGYAVNLPFNKHQLANQLPASRVVNNYFANSGFGGTLAAHTQQKGIVVTWAGTGPDLEVYGLTPPSSDPNRKTPNTVTGPSIVYFQHIWRCSPTTHDLYDDSDNVRDVIGLKKVAGHEVGHALNLDDSSTPGSIMVQGLPCESDDWSTVPHLYNATESLYLEIK